MYIAEVKEKVEKKKKKKNGIEVYAVLKKNDSRIIKLVNIADETDTSDTTSEEMLCGFTTVVANSFESYICSDEVLKLSSADERKNALYYYDLDELPEEMKLMKRVSMDEHEIEVFNFEEDSLDEIVAFITVIGNADRNIILYKQQYPISLLKRDKCMLSPVRHKNRLCNVNNNQDILIEAIKKEKLHSTKDFIIDGHLCVFNAEGKVERIPEYFFVDTGINGIVLLQDDPIVISQRINDRDAEKINVKDLREMQDEEYMYACELQNKFHIKYKVISHNYTGEQFKTLLSSIGGGINE